MSCTLDRIKTLVDTLENQMCGVAVGGENKDGIDTVAGAGLAASVSPCTLAASLRGMSVNRMTLQINCMTIQMNRAYDWIGSADFWIGLP